MKIEGVTVNLNHEQMEKISQTANWGMSVSGALSSVVSGPNGIALGVLATVIKLYSTILKTMDRGNGIQFLIPWIALYPLPNPIYVIPVPL
jgi:hypothetical protein